MPTQITVEALATEIRERPAECVEVGCGGDKQINRVIANKRLKIMQKVTLERSKQTLRLSDWQSFCSNNQKKKR